MNSFVKVRQSPFLPSYRSTAHCETSQSMPVNVSLTITNPAGPIVRFMLQHVALLPRPESSPDPAETAQPYLPLPITCRPCPETLAGGYSPLLGILLCQNRFMSRRHMEDALSHELVHAWDGRRFDVEGEWGKDLRAHACTEVRLSTVRL